VFVLVDNSRKEHLLESARLPNLFTNT